MENIPLPSSIDVERKDAQSATITVTPCYPGYGTTLGNAMRRVLLSSLPGAAITDVKIKGADHEFTTLPNVKEDVVTIILNLKSVRLKLQGDEPMTITLKVKGDKVVKAKDFTVPSQVEIVNGSQVIATLTDKDAEFELEARVAPGRGYIPVETREKEEREIGQIAIDAIYTPVRTVNFSTEHVRVGQMTNFDKLKLDITTDGTIDPEQAFRDAAEVLFAHFDLLKAPLAEKEAEKEEVAEEAEEEVKESE